MTTKTKIILAGIAVAGAAIWWFKFRKSDTTGDSTNGNGKLSTDHVSQNPATNGVNMFASGRALNPNK